MKKLSLVLSLTCFLFTQASFVDAKALEDKTLAGQGSQAFAPLFIKALQEFSCAHNIIYSESWIANCEQIISVQTSIKSLQNNYNLNKASWRAVRKRLHTLLLSEGCRAKIDPSFETELTQEISQEAYQNVFELSQGSMRFVSCSEE